MYKKVHNFLWGILRPRFYRWTNAPKGWDCVNDLQYFMANLNQGFLEIRDSEIKLLFRYQYAFIFQHKNHKKRAIRYYSVVGTTRIWPMPDVQILVSRVAGLRTCRFFFASIKRFVLLTNRGSGDPWWTGIAILLRKSVDASNPNHSLRSAWLNNAHLHTRPAPGRIQFGHLQYTSCEQGPSDDSPPPPMGWGEGVWSSS